MGRGDVASCQGPGPPRPGGAAPADRTRGLVELDAHHRRLRAALAACSVDLKEAPKKLANANNEVEGLEAEHKEVRARQSAEWKKLRAATDNVRVGDKPQDGKVLGLTIPPSLLLRADQVID